MALTIVLIIIAFVCMAMMWTEGLWSNALTAVNVTFAAMLATNYYEPLAKLIDGRAFSYTYVWDYLMLWAIFAISYGLLRAITDQLSRYRVRFKMPMEHVGRVVLSAFATWIVLCFTCFTIHTAPLARTAFRGGFASEPKSSHFLGLAPDRLWLAFVQSRSRGALSQTDTGALSPFPEDGGKRVFDPKSEFILKYGARRNQLNQNMQRTGKLRLRSR